MLVENGATLQIGIGKIPEAVVKYLASHKDLGIHSEMISDGLVDLMLSGVINNRKKNYHKGKAVASFCMGSKNFMTLLMVTLTLNFIRQSMLTPQ